LPLPSLPSSLPATPPSSATSATSSSTPYIFPTDAPASPALVPAPSLFPPDNTTPLGKLQEFLRNAHAALEQYAEAFIKAGCTDLETLLRLSDDEMRTFVEIDLPRVVPRLVEQPFHVRLMASIMGEEKERRREVERIWAITTGDHLFGPSSLPSVNVPPLKMEEELGLPAILPELPAKLTAGGSETKCIDACILP
ncbi:hypothetical protein P7C70_g8936, partial [Phenoliferia sp. Uapishka_3]